MGDIDNAVKKATQALNAAFGKNFTLEGEGAGRFFNEEELKTEYSSVATRDQIASEFTKMSKSVRAMRSSFLPIDFYIDEGLTLGLDPGTISASLVDQVGAMESYENAFMRMLGMPIVDTGTSSDFKITSSQEIKIMNEFTGDIEVVPFKVVREKVLNQRQIVRSDRNIRIDDAIFNLQKAGTQEEALDAAEVLLEEELLSQITLVIDNAAGEESGEDIPVVDRGNDPKVKDIELDLYKFSYLLIPPIQDGKISGCINEPGKIVAPPFSNVRARNINNKKIRPTLLESVIRIRLDRNSGTNSFVSPSEEETMGASISLGANAGDPSEAADDYGILESLFILRLRSALAGLADKTMADIDELITQILKSNREPPNIDNGSSSNGGTNIEAATPTLKSKDDPSKLIDNDLIIRKQQRLIEDSIFILLGDNSEVLDLQTQTQRNSSIQDAHLMSGIIDVVSIPRKRLEKEIKETEMARDKTAEDSTEHLTSELGTVLGSDTGIGTVDIIVFCLALFTIEEKNLLGLLDPEAFEKLKNDESTRPLLPNEGDQVDPVTAINRLTEILIEGYNLFVKELKDDISLTK